MSNLQPNILWYCKQQYQKDSVWVLCKAWHRSQPREALTRFPSCKPTVANKLQTWEALSLERFPVGLLEAGRQRNCTLLREGGKQEKGQIGLWSTPRGMPSGRPLALCSCMAEVNSSSCTLRFSWACSHEAPSVLRWLSLFLGEMGIVQHAVQSGCHATIYPASERFLWDAK